MIQRTISAMDGKGSINHNCRKFTAENVDPSRSRFGRNYSMGKYLLEVPKWKT